MKWTEAIQLPRLDIEGRGWTMETKLLKMAEEFGEASQAFNKDQDPEKLAAETFDVIQTGVTMLYILESKGIDVQTQFVAFLEKLEARNYLRR